MTVVDDLRVQLVADGAGVAGYSSTGGVSLFVDSLPESTGIAAVLSVSASVYGDRHYGNDVPDIERPRVELLVRSTAPASGGSVPTSTASKAAAEGIYRSLVSIANQAVNGSTFLSVDADAGGPYLLDRDPQGRIYWRCAFAVDRVSS